MQPWEPRTRGLYKDVPMCVNPTKQGLAMRGEREGKGINGKPICHRNDKRQPSGGQRLPAADNMWEKKAKRDRCVRLHVGQRRSVKGLSVGVCIEREKTKGVGASLSSCHPTPSTGTASLSREEEGGRGGTRATLRIHPEKEGGSAWASISAAAALHRRRPSTPCCPFPVPDHLSSATPPAASPSTRQPS